MGIERDERARNRTPLVTEREPTADRTTGDYVPFYATGDSAKGAFKCSDCGYGVAIAAVLPRCPMCGGESWEEATWSPFGRAGNAL